MLIMGIGRIDSALSRPILPIHRTDAAQRFYQFDFGIEMCESQRNG
jgi:hypothetical protein